MARWRRWRAVFVGSVRSAGSLTVGDVILGVEVKRTVGVGGGASGCAGVLAIDVVARGVNATVGVFGWREGDGGIAGGACRRGENERAGTPGRGGGVCVLEAGFVALVAVLNIPFAEAMFEGGVPARLTLAIVARLNEATVGVTFAEQRGDARAMGR